jgi:hypothetical protein
MALMVIARVSEKVFVEYFEVVFIRTGMTNGEKHGKTLWLS